MIADNERPVLDGYTITPKDEARFWEKVDRDSDPNGCWLWTKAVDQRGGYGAVGLGSSIKRAHRVAWVLTKGPIPEGLVVRHGPQCEDRPGREGRRCVNPDHLMTGTQGQNLADKNGGWFRLDPDEIPTSPWLRDAAKAFLQSLVPDGEEGEKANTAEPERTTPKTKPSST